MDLDKLVEMAIDAVQDDKDDKRTYVIGAVAVRKDGKIVKSCNISLQEGPARHGRNHAEARVLQKAGLEATVVVVRVLKNGKLANSKPCPKCENWLRSKRVKKCYYTDDTGNINSFTP